LRRASKPGEGGQLPPQGTDLIARLRHAVSAIPLISPGRRITTSISIEDLAQLFTISNR